MLSQNYCDNYITDINSVNNILDKYGVAIIPNILNDAEIKEAIDGMWDYLELVTSKFKVPLKRNTPKTYKSFYELLPLHSMLLQHWQSGHSQFIWNLRQNTKIIDIFCKIHNVKREELLVSFDGFSFSVPHEVTKRGYYKNNTWYHTDQSLIDLINFCIQGWVTLFDVNEGDATLTFLEGSHKFHEEFGKTFHITDKQDWYQINMEEHLKFFIDRGCSIKNIVCKAGSLVLWNSKTFHAGKEALKNRENTNFRGVVYVCYTPKILCNQKTLKKKQKAFNEKRMTSHWPHKVKLFPKTPRLYSNPKPDVTEVPDPNLNELGKILAGF
jgi:ectoine hydroxylase-related dioxygenase (phytanoyl-CoA dioxygenase family)